MQLSSHRLGRPRPDRTRASAQPSTHHASSKVSCSLTCAPVRTALHLFFFVSQNWGFGQPSSKQRLHGAVMLVGQLAALRQPLPLQTCLCVPLIQSMVALCIQQLFAHRLSLSVLKNRVYTAV